MQLPTPVADELTTNVEVPFAPAPISASPPRLNVFAGVVVAIPTDPLVVPMRSPFAKVDVAVVEVANRVPTVNPFARVEVEFDTKFAIVPNARREPGVVVPMPKLPDASIRACSVPAVANPRIFVPPLKRPVAGLLIKANEGTAAVPSAW